MRFRARAYLLLLWTLVGCNNHLGDYYATSAALNLKLKGQVLLPTLSGTTVSAYNLNINGARGSLLASTGTGSSNSYQLQLNNVSTPVLLVATGGQYIEPANGGVTSLAGRELYAILNPQSPNQVLAINSFTHIAAVRALAQMGLGQPPAAAAALANRLVAKAVGLDFVQDITSVQPVDPGTNLAAQDVLASSPSAQLTLLQAAVSQFAVDQGAGDSFQVSQNLAAVFVTNAGFDASWNPTLNNEQARYIANAANNSVFSSSSELNLILAPRANDVEVLLAADLALGAVSTFTVSSLNTSLTPGPLWSGDLSGFTDIQCLYNQAQVVGIMSDSTSNTWLKSYTFNPASGALSAYSVLQVVYNAFANLTLDPATSFLFVNNYVADTLNSYQLNPSTLGLSTAASLTLNAGSAPGDIALNPVIPYLYALEDLTQKIDVFAKSPTTGALTAVQSLALAQVSYTPLQSLVDPLGRFVYVINQSGSAAVPASISLYAVNLGNGQLSYVSDTPIGLSPSAAAITSDGRFLILAAFDTGQIVTFKTDPLSGAPQAMGSIFAVNATNGATNDLALDPFGNTLFTTGYDNNGNGYINIFQLERTTGNLTLISTVPTASDNPGSLALCTQNI